MSCRTQHAGPVAITAPAPVLGIDDGVFTVNGQKKFLLFFSYFGALRDTDVNQKNRLYFQLAKSYGFDGVRVFPNWWLDQAGGGPQCGGGRGDETPLMSVDGSLITTAKTRLKKLLDIAYEEGLVVELALAYETVTGLTPEKFRTGAANVAAWLETETYSASSAPAQTGYRHVFLDLQNEFNVVVHGPPEGEPCKKPFTPEFMRSIRDEVKTVDDDRLVTASIAEGEKPRGAWNLHVATGVDIMGYHDRRTDVTIPGVEDEIMWPKAAWERVTILRGLSNSETPIYFSETYPQSQAPADWDVQAWLGAAMQAKGAGAAAWCWHNEALFYWSTKRELSNIELAVAAQLGAALSTVTWPRQ